jgi:hypothetical protein
MVFGWEFHRKSFSSPRFISGKEFFFQSSLV